MKPQVVWSIAGFDPSSGAGITADLMTFAAHGLFGCSAITALTVQSTRGVAGVQLISPRILAETLDHLAEDLPPAGVKIGMIGSGEAAAVIAAFLRRQNRPPLDRTSTMSVPVVFDPVLRSSSGRELYPASAMAALNGELLPFVDWITPNWDELALLAEQPVSTVDEAANAARVLIEKYPQINVVATGGDQPLPTDLLVLHSGERIEIEGEHVETTSTHGTGCAFSSALLAHLVQRISPEQAVRGAKAYVTGALRRAPGLGHGRGPLGLLWPLTRRQNEFDL
ncbi:MAG: bifunctional hydroxymethylpyrimidine kinase/phosphomethylpyrimidine kinase [Janthinobacterium lividum]